MVPWRLSGLDIQIAISRILDVGIPRSGWHYLRSLVTDCQQKYPGGGGYHGLVMVMKVYAHHINI